MCQPQLQFGRTAPFFIFDGLLVNPASAEPRGHWLFVDDGTAIAVRPCADGATALCGVITRLPKSAAALLHEDRKAVCSVALLGDLQPASAKNGERARLDGWVIDIDSMTPEGKAPRYAASFVILSETRARLEVRGASGIVLDRHQLMRAPAPITNCK